MVAGCSDTNSASQNKEVKNWEKQKKKKEEGE